MVAASHDVSWFKQPAFQVLLILPAVGPALAAVIVQRALVGKKGTNFWFRSLWRWKAGVRWLVVSVTLPAVLLLAESVVERVLGLTASGIVSQRTAGLVFGAFVIALVSNPWEEVGWRGFALPRLQKDHSAFFATLVVGILWALWHLPLFFWAENPMSQYPFLLWSVNTIAEAFIYTWLYNSTQGSVLAVALYHVLNNTYGALLGSGSIPARLVVTVTMAAILLGAHGTQNLSRGERVCAG